jgi:hypothetical protein
MIQHEKSLAEAAAQVKKTQEEAAGEPPKKKRKAPDPVPAAADRLAIPGVKEALHGAFQYLRDQCDRAHSKDGCGFNRLDQEFGHAFASANLADIPLDASWEIAFNSMRKYKNQIGEETFEAIYGGRKPNPGLAESIFYALKEGASPRELAFLERKKEGIVLTIDGAMWNQIAEIDEEFESHIVSASLLSSPKAIRGEIKKAGEALERMRAAGAPEALTAKRRQALDSLTRRRNPSIPEPDIQEGMAHEAEHSPDPDVQRKIALDHLEEDEDYYRKLAKCGL